MCVLAMAWRAHPRWQLVVAGNRDELHARPSEPLGRWETDPELIAGRDAVSGGSWMGVTEKGRFAVVTNLRGFGGPDPKLDSRGALVSDYLAQSLYPDSNGLGAFNPFNLIVVDGDGAHFLANHPDPLVTPLPPGLYGLSNGQLDEPWPKTLSLKSALQDWLVTADNDFAPLFDALASEEIPDAGIEPDTPSDVALEPSRSPVFIRNPLYGTRCSTIIAIDAEGTGRIAERRFSASATLTGETATVFRWPHTKR